MERLRKKESGKITELPTEILNAVLSYLPCNDDLVNVSRLSRRFNILVEPVLYNTITLEMPKFAGTERWFNRDYRFCQLANTLEENPHVRQYIMKLQLLVSDNPARVNFNQQQQILNLVPALRELVLRNPPDCLQLHQLQRLESLCIEFYNPAARGLVNILEVKQNEPFEIVARYLWIRTLKRLCLKKLWCNRFPGACVFPKERRRTAAITDLVIMQCPGMLLSILLSILKSIKILTSFVFEGRISLPYIRCWEPLSQALKIHKNTLVELCIVDADSSLSRTPGDSGSMRDYTSLRRLAIPETYLQNQYDLDFYEMLPGSLETFQLQCYKNACRTGETRMESLAKYKFEFMPVLGSVFLWDVVGQNHDNIKSSTDKLTNLFEDVGVRFSWVTGRSFSETPFGMESRLP